MAHDAPPTALMASARPPVPLAPRLTPAWTPPLLQEATRASHAHSTDPSPSVTVSTSSRAPSTPLRRRKHTRPLLHRVSQPSATPAQALSTESTATADRFAAYVPSAAARTAAPSASAHTAHHTLSSSRSPHAASSTTHATGTRVAEDALGHTLRTHIPRHEATFEVLPAFRADAHYPGNVLVRCAGWDFYVHKA